MKRGHYDDVAEAIFTAPGVTRDQLSAFLEKSLGKDKEPDPELRKLLSLKRTAGVLTTNFDNLIDRLLPTVPPHTFEDGELLAERSNKGQFFYCKLYGDLNSQILLLSPGAFRATVGKYRAFLDFMHGVVVSKTLLFLGCSLDGIENYLNALPLHDVASRGHYALVPVNGEEWQTRATLLQRRYNIEVIPYALDPEHTGFTNFVDELFNRLTEVDREWDPGTDNTRFRGIQQIHLENIGPHEQLSLSLDQGWNVLLGDNGVGKTHVLKAIALAACGKEADVSGLLRTGAARGRIALTTADTEIEIVLTRRNGRVETTVVPASLLETEGFFIMGFPPLRTANRPVNESPTNRPKRPTAEDVLPLLAGDLDPRMSRLKNWLIQLDHIITSNTEPKQVKGYLGLRDSLFEILSDLTEGVTLEFGRVDAVKNEVYVKTDDGEVPIESISQGMTSLLGWIGVLLHRLHEIYEAEENPRDFFGLVLIDEIDAHMHPEWQQVLIPRLTKFFPNFQFVATTHSPLIVGDMPHRQVIRLARDEHGKVISLPLTDEMMQGRADQILTGRLFGLRTTMGHLTLQKIEEYKDLAGRERDEAEEKRYQVLKRELATKIPPPDETPLERKAYSLLEAILEQEVGINHPGTNEKILAKARTLLQEAAEASP